MLSALGPVVEKETLWWILLGAGVLFIIVSLVLEFHWLRYGGKARRIILAELFYFFVSIILIGSAVMAVEAF
ncbi:MAG: hypothetical protein HYT43_00520 [Candidatus Taylorbacteria bacterium]|nr:hypothetical protein [Candidatus Taylorbacteria bacterium]